MSHWSTCSPQWQLRVRVVASGAGRLARVHLPHAGGLAVPHVALRNFAAGSQSASVECLGHGRRYMLYYPLHAVAGKRTSEITR
eukprot:6928558-Alexandrium_andersonii.AAC.1